MARTKSKVNSTTGGLPNWAVIQPGMEPLKLNGMLKDYKRLLWEAEYYVHYEIAASSFVSAYIKYCEREFDKKEPALLKKLPEYDMTVVGKWAYLAMKGVGLEETKKAFMKQKYEELMVKARAIADAEKKKAAEKAKEKSVAVVISIQQRMREQVSDLCAEFDQLVDELCVNNLAVNDFNPHTMMKVYRAGIIKPAHAKIIREMYEGQYSEAKEIVAWKDEQIKEGYAYMTPKMRKDYLAFFEKIITACDTYINTGKAVRKTRMPKPVSKEKKVAKLKYQVSEPTLGLASINPIQILDATMLWIYNSKTRKLGCYVAEHASNLSAKGTSVIGFDEVKSIQKTVRKPEVLLKGIDKLPRTKIQKLFDEIKATETRMNGRINDTTILLKTF
jgi:hypothetical protein